VVLCWPLGVDTAWFKFRFKLRRKERINEVIVVPRTLFTSRSTITHLPLQPAFSCLCARHSLQNHIHITTQCEKQTMSFSLHLTHLLPHPLPLLRAKRLLHTPHNPFLLSKRQTSAPRDLAVLSTIRDFSFGHASFKNAGAHAVLRHPLAVFLLFLK